MPLARDIARRKTVSLERRAGFHTEESEKRNRRIDDSLENHDRSEFTANL
jgi:hypothetical protein